MPKDDPLVSLEEIAVSNMLEIHTVIRILERIKLIIQDEILKEVSVLKKDMEEKIGIFRGRNRFIRLLIKILVSIDILLVKVVSVINCILICTYLIN